MGGTNGKDPTIFLEKYDLTLLRKQGLFFIFLDETSYCVIVILHW